MARAKKVMPVSFWGAVKNYWMGYVDFDGCTTRREYWYVWLFRLMLMFVCLILPSAVLWSIVSAVMFLPSRALAFRRFHDAGLSGWWYLAPMLFITIYSAIRSDFWVFLLNLDQFPGDLVWITLLSFVYLIELFVVFVQPSKMKDNKYRK